MPIRTVTHWTTCPRAITSCTSSPTCRRHPPASANCRHVHRGNAGSVAAVSAVPVPVAVAISVLVTLARSCQQYGLAHGHLASRLHGNYRPGLLFAAGLPGHADAEA